MRTPFRSLRSWAILVAATPGLSAVALAEYPPAPPTVVRLVQLSPVPDPQSGFGDTLAVPPAFGPELPAGGAPVEFPEADTEAYARGPVHEAFADTYELNPAPSEIVALQPPEPVDELPPAQAPEGENVQWISGYWAWDVETKDHMWVSGIWRDVPPGRRWVPGYWATATGGYQWVTGFWADARTNELSYVPAPPESLEVGPNIPAPTEEHVWIPGSWSYVEQDYRWSPGYWDPCQTDYMWVPNQYQWTPTGCVYVPGYRDYRFARRGLLFSPVRFRRSFVGYNRPWFYRPRNVVNMSGFVIHLFVRPRVRHLYYGDFYGNQYAQFGYSPWFRRGWSGRYYRDPVLDFYRCDSRRNGVNFFQSVNTWHNRYETNVGFRPPHLIRDQAAFMDRHRGDRTAELAVMTNRLDDVVRAPRSGGPGFRNVDARELVAMRDVSKVSRTIETTRRQFEREGADKLPDGGIDLRPRDTREPGARPAKELGRLSLGDVPEPIREKTNTSINTAEQLRERIEKGERNIRVIGRDSDGQPLGEGLTKDRNGDRTPERDMAEQRRDQERTERSGRENEPSERMKKGDQPAVVGDGNDPRNEKFDDLRRQIEERKQARDQSVGRTNDPNVPKPVNPPNVGREGRDIPSAANPVREERGSENQARMDDLRQQIEARKAARDADVEARRQSGTPGELPKGVVRESVPRTETGRPENGSNPQRTERMDDLRQRIDERQQGREAAPPTVRERSNPEPRREATPPPRMERAPVERTPVERAPREVPQRTERAPVERAPVERAPREVPQRMERAPVERAPVERAPREVERRAPAERAPRDSGSSRRRGND